VLEEMAEVDERKMIGSETKGKVVSHRMSMER
jgi:hypothetical protein